jgi:hypothetical protein
MKRLLLAGAAALALTLGASACGSVDPNAAVVHGTAIKVRDIEADVAAIVALNTPDDQSPGIGLPANGVREILSFEIQGLLLEKDPASPIAIDAAALEVASGQFEEVWPGKWATAPAAVKERLSRAAAAINLAQARSEGADQFSAYMTEMLAASTVKINPRYGSWDPIVGQIAPPIPLTTTR